VSELRVCFPEAKILLLGLFPRDRKGSVTRAQVTEVNIELAKLHDGERVHFLDIGSSFLDGDGNFLPGVMPDRLHPSEKGYEIWAREIRAPLRALLAEAP
jgi:beta-glucosidase